MLLKTFCTTEEQAQRRSRCLTFVASTCTCGCCRRSHNAGRGLRAAQWSPASASAWSRLGTRQGNRPQEISLPVKGKRSRSLWESCGKEGLAGWAAVPGEPHSAFLTRKGCSGRRVPFLHKRAAFHQVLPRRNLGRAFVSCREATYYAPYLTNCWNRLIV